MPGWMGDRPARIPESEYTNGGGGARVAVLAHREIQNPSGADQSNATRGEITRRIRVTIRPQFYKPKAVTREILSSRRSIDPLGPSVDTNAKLTLLDVFCRVEARKELFS